MEGRGAALPIAPQLEEVGLRDPGPIRSERLDAGGELTQGSVDVTGGAVELDRHVSQLFRGDPDAHPVHIHLTMTPETNLGWVVHLEAIGGKRVSTGVTFGRGVRWWWRRERP